MSEAEVLNLCRLHGANVIRLAAEEAMRGNHAPLGSLNLTVLGMPQLHRLAKMASKAGDPQKKTSLRKRRVARAPATVEEGPTIPEATFVALASLKSFRTGAVREASRMVLVDGWPAREAAVKAGTPHAAVNVAVGRLREALELARVAVRTSDEAMKLDREREQAANTALDHLKPVRQRHGARK